MNTGTFVGREHEIQRLKTLIAGTKVANRNNTTVVSIEGSGGIGKTFFLDHVLDMIDIRKTDFLVMRVDGRLCDKKNHPSENNLTELVYEMVGGAKGLSINEKPSAYYFDSVAKFKCEFDLLRNNAIQELEKKRGIDKDKYDATLSLINDVLILGGDVNEIVPGTKHVIDFTRGKTFAKDLEKTIRDLDSLKQKTPWILERLGIGSGTTYRNSIKRNACNVLSDSLTSDLSSILCGYQKKDLMRPRHKKIAGLNRLLLIIDDYEATKNPFEHFLINGFLEALGNARFKSVLILVGRDKYNSTEISWDQHLSRYPVETIEICALSQEEMNQLLEKHGVRDDNEKERAWRDTKGFPFLTREWIKEIESGGRTAVFLRSFYERTTRWMSENQRKWLEICIFLDRIDKPRLRAMMRGLKNEQDWVEKWVPSESNIDEEADNIFRWFENEGSIRDKNADSFRVIEFLRSRLVDYLKLADEEKCEVLQRNARIATQSNR